MPGKELHVVAGAFGYSGKYIAARLLQQGHGVRTLTNSIGRANSFGGQVEAHPFNWDKFDALTDSLRRAAVLYNTYWVHFNYTNFKHAVAVENTRKLFEAAKRAGVSRVVHVSITNPPEDSPPAGDTKLTDWTQEHAKTLGLHYASELARRHNRRAAYASLS